MIIPFLIISVIVTIILIYALGRMFLSHNKLIEEYKENEFLLQFHFTLGMFLTAVIFIILISCNNTFWHLK